MSSWVRLLVMETHSTTLSGRDPLLTIEALAKYLHVPVAAIRD